MGEVYGVKETKEAIVGLLKLAGVMGGLLRDGVQASDALELMNKLMGDEVLKAALMAAYSDVSKIPDEVKDLSMSEGLELISAVVAEIPGLLANIKK